MPEYFTRRRRVIQGCDGLVVSPAEVASFALVGFAPLGSHSRATSSFSLARGGTVS